MGHEGDRERQEEGGASRRSQTRTPASRQDAKANARKTGNQSSRPAREMLRNPKKQNDDHVVNRLMRGIKSDRPPSPRVGDSGSDGKVDRGGSRPSSRGSVTSKSSGSKSSAKSKTPSSKSSSPKSRVKSGTSKPKPEAKSGTTKTERSRRGVRSRSSSSKQSAKGSRSKSSSSKGASRSPSSKGSSSKKPKG